MKEKPDALFIIDSHMEHLAVKEAKRMNVPIVAIVDTNADPHIIDYPIPANDDATGSIELIISYILGAWDEGRKALKTKSEEAKKKEEAKQKESQKDVEKKEEKKVPAKKDTKKTPKKEVKKKK